MTPEALDITTKIFNERTLAVVGVVEFGVIVYLHKQLTGERGEHMNTARQILPLVQKLVSILERRAAPRKRTTQAPAKVAAPEEVEP